MLSRHVRVIATKVTVQMLSSLDAIPFNAFNNLDLHFGKYGTLSLLDSAVNDVFP